jgi:Tfp pilus assembly protein PilN
MKILALKFPEKRYVLVQKTRRGNTVLGHGQITPELLPQFKKAHRVLVEIEGCRFLNNQEYAQKSVEEIREILDATLIHTPENRFRLAKSAFGQVATIREPIYQQLKQQMTEMGLKPAAIVPVGTGLTAWYRQNNSGHMGEPSKADLGGIDPSDASLWALAMFSTGEKEGLNFADASMIEAALEPEKKKRSYLIAAGLVLGLLTIPMYLGYQEHALQDLLAKEQLKFKVTQKRITQVKKVQDEATGYFTDLMKVAGASASGRSLTEGLLQITQSVPPSITLTGLQQAGAGTFVLNGNAPEMADVFQFEAQLKKGLFKESKVIDSRQTQREGKEAMIFKMEVR